jgi:aminoglycoside phosphotransferase
LVAGGLVEDCGGAVDYLAALGVADEREELVWACLQLRSDVVYRVVSADTR